MQNNVPHLTSRLALVASFVRKGVPVADIGTDHAYVPVFLVNSGITPRAIASDVRPGPLERAKMTARSYAAQDKIAFTLADGLDGIESSQADDIVIAGMGGELISDIIGRCKWLKDPKKHLVLQPMTAQEELREYLCENGFTIEKEAVATEKNERKLYVVMSVYFSGQKRKADPLYCFAGELPKNLDDNARAYLEYKSRVLNKKAAGLSMSKNENQDEIKKIKSLADRIMEVAARKNSEKR